MKARSSLLDSSKNRTAEGIASAHVKNTRNFHLAGAWRNTAPENENGELGGGGARGDEFVFFDFGGDPGLALIL